MNILVFGATGRVGKACVDRALAAGHHVSAVIRDPKVTIANVDITIGNATDPDIVLKDDHAIVGALGGAEALTKGYANIVRAAGTRRLIALVGAGVLQADATRLRNQLPEYPPRLREIGAAHQTVYETLRDSSLDWTLVCVPNIVEGPPTNNARSKLDYLPQGKGSITTGDIAAFMIEELAARRYARARVGLNTITGSGEP